MYRLSKAFRFLSIGLPFLSVAPVASAATLTYSRGETLGGWNERSFTTTWSNGDPDVKNLVSTDSNGDLRGFNHPSMTVWLQSPAFILEPGEITIASVFLMGSGSPAPASDAEVSGLKSASGWGGVALRDAEGNFVLTYSAATVWAPVTFTAAQLDPYVGQTLTLDFINMNNSNGDFMYINRPITIEGSLAAVPEPSVCLLGAAGVIGLLRRRRPVIGC